MDEIAQQKGVDPAAIEIWFTDEARVGQLNKITGRWARRGPRPAAPKDQRTASTYIFGRSAPGSAKGLASCCPAATCRHVPAPGRDGNELLSITRGVGKHQGA